MLAEPSGRFLLRGLRLDELHDPSPRRPLAFATATHLVDESWIVQRPLPERCWRHIGLRQELLDSGKGGVKAFHAAYNDRQMPTMSRGKPLLAIAYYDEADCLPMWTSDQARFYVRDTLAEHGYELAELSRLIGHKDAYLNQYIKQRTPVWLKQEEREALCKLVPQLDESLLKKPPVAVSAPKKSSRQRRNQAQINAERPDQPKDDPRILQLIDAYRAISSEENRALLLTLAQKLASESGAVIA